MNKNLNKLKKTLIFIITIMKIQVIIHTVCKNYSIYLLIHLLQNKKFENFFVTIIMSKIELININVYFILMFN